MNKDTGWTVGDCGAILRTSDGGATWVKQESSTTNSLHGITFLDSINGIIVGGYNNHGIIIRTTDGGNNWTTQSSSYDYTFESIVSLNNLIAFAVGDSGKILKTTDAGIHWTEQNSGCINDLKSVSFLDTCNGVAVGYGAAISTTNGGISWSVSNSSLIPPLWLRGVYFSNLNHVTAVSMDGIILFSSDGGNNWIQQFAQNTYTLFSVSFIDTLNGVVVGGNYPYEGGVIFRTSDGGTNWAIQRNDIERNLLSIIFSDLKKGTAVGFNGIIFRTLDGGNTWTKQWSSILNDPSNEFFGVSFYDKNNGIVVGSNIFRTSDGGTNWVRPDSVGTFSILLGIQFINSKIGIAVGGHGVIIKTTDGGKTWFNLTTGNNKNLEKVCFTDINTGFVCGDQGVILKTTDGGKTWLDKSMNDTYYTGISFTEANTGTIAGGIMIRTTDGGNSWVTQSAIITRDVFFIDNKIGWAAGDGGVISHTTDGGATWINQNSGTTLRLWRICFTDKNNGTIVGSGFEPASIILRTTNGGENWIRQPDITGYELEDVFFSDPYNGTIVGLSGTILHTTNGGISFIGNENPLTELDNFVLYQNYPNPFNPSTKIKFNLSHRGYVSLVVYDVLGRIVKTLVDEELNAGKYTKEFTPANLASGIYLYCLKTPNAIYSKKMIFIK
jgi:photosystem II stability/assembly factor-like uncharacterized protein